MIRLLQIVPVADCRLYGQIVKKEIEFNRKNRGTFYRSGSKEHNHAKWSHSKYSGWIKLQRTEGEVVTAEIRSLSKSGDDWQLLHAFIGWLDRNFGDQIESLHIHYRRMPKRRR